MLWNSESTSHLYCKEVEKEVAWLSESSPQNGSLIKKENKIKSHLIVLISLEQKPVISCLILCSLLPKIPNHCEGYGNTWLCETMGIRLIDVMKNKN